MTISVRSTQQSVHVLIRFTDPLTGAIIDLDAVTWVPMNDPSSLMRAVAASCHKGSSELDVAFYPCGMKTYAEPEAAQLTKPHYNALKWAVESAGIPHPTVPDEYWAEIADKRKLARAALRIVARMRNARA
jgi:hypothetical protein